MTDDDELARGGAVGRYVVLDRLGRGAMGAVYAAYDPELMRRVALKVLRPQAIARQGHEAARQGLLREAQALARLAHPNVVRVFDVGTDDARVFLAMELVEGESLRHWLGVPRRWREVLEVMEQAARGLAAAHALGLVHRDFKPDNVLVASDGRVRVGDFGLVRRVDEIDGPTELSETVGTPAYMAPEQHAGEDAEPRSDQYAFCLTLFEALYGRRPFDVGAPDDREALIGAKQRGEGIDGGSRGAMGRIPNALRAVVQRGLSPDPSDRFAAMGPLLVALERVRTRAGAWRGAAVVAGLMVMGTAGWAVADPASGTTPCAGAAEPPSAAWSDASRMETQARLAQHLPVEATARALAGLDARVEAWTQAHRDACEDTWVRGEQSSARLDARMVCLRGQWAELEETVALLREADLATAERSPELVLGLPSPVACARSVPRQGHARTAASAEAEATRATLARVSALRRAARFDEAWAELEAWDELEGSPTVEAAARAHARGLVLDDRGLLDQSEQAFARSLELARAAGDDRGEADAWLGLSGATADRMHDPERARFQAEMALAAVASVGGDERIESWAETMLGSVAFREGDDLRARAHWERALALRQALWGDDHLLTASSLNNLGGVLYGQGALDDAAELLERALQVREGLLGPEHPTVAESAINLSLVLVAQGRTPEAVRRGERGLEILQHTLGDDHPMLVRSHDALAQALLADGRAEPAREHFERARALAQIHLPPLHPSLLAPLLGLTEIELEAGDPVRAEAWAREAIAVVADETIDPLMRAEARSWLARALAAQDRADESRTEARAARALAQEVGERGKELRDEIDAWLGVLPQPSG